MTPVQKWEYETRPLCHPGEIPYKYPHEIMRKAGNEGWEAICIHESYIYFKRPKPASLYPSQEVEGDNEISFTDGLD